MDGGWPWSLLKCDWLLIPFLFPKESNQMVLFVIIMAMKHFTFESHV
jgi:hypothetical protein